MNIRSMDLPRPLASGIESDWAIERLVQKNLDCKSLSLVCGVCQYIAHHPPNLVCGHTFCVGCLAKWVEHANKNKNTKSRGTCPECRTAFDLATCQRNMLLERQIAQLEVYCAEEGCTATMTLKSMQSHLEEACMVRPVACKWQSQGCSQVVRRAQLAAHEDRDCLFRTEACADCHQQVRVDRIPLHKPAELLPCSGMKPCPNACDSITATTSKQQRKQQKRQRQRQRRPVVMQMTRPVLAPLPAAAGTMHVGNIVFYSPDALERHCVSECVKRRETCAVCRVEHLVVARAPHKQSLAHIEALETSLLELQASVDIHRSKPLPPDYEVEQLIRSPISCEHATFATPAHLATFECETLSDGNAWMRLRVGKLAHSQDLHIRIDLCQKPGVEPSAMCLAEHCFVYLHPIDSGEQHGTSHEHDVSLVDLTSYLVRTRAEVCATDPHDPTTEDSETIEREWTRSFHAHLPMHSVSREKAIPWFGSNIVFLSLSLQ